MSDDVRETLARIEDRLSRIEDAHLRIAAVVDELKPEVTAMIDNLTANPMVRMLMGGKK